MDEAERYANEDKAKKEEVETCNQADSLIYQTERTMKEMEGKLDPADSAKLADELAQFKKVRESNDVSQIKPAMEKFSQMSYEIFGKIYQQQQQAGPQGGQSGPTVNDDGTVESSFEENNNN